MLNKSRYAFINIQQLSGNKIQYIEFLNKFKNHFVDEIIWIKGKGQPAMQKNVMNSRFEHILIFAPNDNPTRTINTASFHGTVPNYYEGLGNSKNEFSAIHAATFPIHLPQHIIQTFTQTNNIVLDCFLGTGTTLIACEQTNRRCYGMELDPSYIDVIIERWENFTGKKAQKL